jgi:3-hydroxy-3-methylglutaryl CoA synthase
MSEDKEKEENLKDLKAILDVAKMLSDKSPYFKGRGSKKEYIKMLVHKIKKLSEAKQKKIISTIDAYNKVRKPTMPKSRAMKNKKAYDRKDFKKGRYD